MTDSGGIKNLALGDSIKVDLGRLLGRGGTSDVYAAVRVCDGVKTPCAVKFLKRLVDGSVDPQLAKRFEREIKVLRAINDHNDGVVRLYDAGVSDRGPWYAMELVEAPTLRALMTKAGPIPEPRVRATLASIAGILADLYERHRVIHRDIKPDNVFVFADGRCKIADLGLAKSLLRGQTALTSQNGSFAGTIQYVPPEVVTSPDKADHRSDIYSFGVLGYEMLTGANPFIEARYSEQFHSDPEAVLARQIHAKPVPPSGLLPEVTPAFEDLLLRCMAKDPAERPQSWHQLIDELTGQTSPNASRAKQAISPSAAVGTRDGAPNPARRRVTLVTVAAAVGIVGLVIAVIAWGPWRGRGIAGERQPQPNLSNDAEKGKPDSKAAGEKRDTQGDQAPENNVAPTASDLLSQANSLYRRRDVQGARRILAEAKQQGHATREHHILAAKVSILERDLGAARTEIELAKLESGHVLERLVALGRNAESLGSTGENSPSRLEALVDLAQALADLRINHAAELQGDPLLHAGAIYYELLARVAYEPETGSGSLVDDARALDPKFEPPGRPGAPIDCSLFFREAKAALQRRDTTLAETLLALKSKFPSRFSTDFDALSSDLLLLRAALAGRNGEVLKVFENRRLSIDTPGIAALSVVAERIRAEASLTETPLRELEWTPRIPPGVEDHKVFPYVKEGALVLEVETDMAGFTSNLPFARHGFELGGSFSPASQEGDMMLFLTFAKGKGRVVVRLRKGQLELVEIISDGEGGEKDGTLYAELAQESNRSEASSSFRVTAIPFETWLVVLVDDRPWFVLRDSRPVPDNLMLTSKKGTLRLTSLKVGSKAQNSKDQGGDR
jgi:hypothetical protein